MSHVIHPLTSADISIFFTGNQQILLYQEYKLYLEYNLYYKLYLAFLESL